MGSGADRHPAGHRARANLRLAGVAPVTRVIPGSGRGASVCGVRCPTCSSLDDKVVDSRTADDGTAIRRRRECLSCGRRYTTFERLEEVPLVVVKRSGDRVPFDRQKIEDGVQSAAKGRPVTANQLLADHE